MDLERLQKTLKRHEGLSLKPYKCSANKLTIGYGRNLEDNGITQEEADHMLNTDIEVCIKEASTLPFWNDLSPVRKEIIVNMVFNLGMPRLSQFRKFFAALSAKDYNAAAFEMENSRWASQVGYRAEELSDMMRLNRYVK